MKKVFLSVALFFSMFFLYNKVSAQTCTSQYNLSYYNFEQVENSTYYDDIMEHMLTTFENQSTYENYMIVYTTSNSSDQQIKMIMFNGRGTIYWSNTTTLRWHSDNQSIQIITASNIFNGRSYTTSTNTSYSYVLWYGAYPPSYTLSPVFIDTNTSNFKYDDWDHATCLRSASDTYTELYGEVTMPTYGYNQIPEITFSSTSLTSNNNIYQKNVTVNFETVDNNLYNYFILDTRNNTWNQITLSNTPTYTITARENYVIYAEIRDKNGGVISSGSYAISDIDTNISITFEEEKIFAEDGVRTGSWVYINYYSPNPSDYTYKYFIWYLDDNNPLPTMTHTTSQAKARLVYDGVVYAEIIENSTNDVVASASYTISDNLNVPAINFNEFVNLENERYLCGVNWYCFRNCVSSDIITINYGYLDNSKYIYQYSYDGENWNNVSLTCNNAFDDTTACASYDIEVFNNKLIIGRVIDKNNNVVAMSSFYVANIGICDDDTNFDDSRQTIKGFSSYLSSFGDLFSYFYNNLNPYVKSTLFAIFTLLIIAAIIKNLRRY